MRTMDGASVRRRQGHLCSRVDRQRAAGNTEKCAKN